MDLKEILKSLCETDGVSGFEKNACELAERLLAPCCDRVEIDAFNNVIGYRDCGIEGAKTLILDAHIDQIGFMVTEVLDGGFLRFTEVGGVDPRMLLGAEVTILAGTPYYGVISCLPPHLLSANEQDKAVPINEMVIDTGFLDAKDKIKVGTPIVFAENLCALSSDSVTGKCLDDRAGFAAIVKAADKLKDEKLKVNVVYMASSQEEVGSLGAGVGTYRIRPEFGIAIDVSHAKTPDAPSDKTFEFGGGVMIGMGPNMHKGLTKTLVKTAKAEDIPYQIEVMEGHTGTNAWSMQVVRSGVAMAVLSIPLRYMHTPIETVKLCDVDAVSDLLAAFIKNFNGEVQL